MVTLERPLRRVVQIDGEPYVVTIDAHGVRVVRKGHRKGVDASWKEILAGDVTLRAQLAQSLEKPMPTAPAKQGARR